jgi:hypothetical protein
VKQKEQRRFEAPASLRAGVSFEETKGGRPLPDNLFWHAFFGQTFVNRRMDALWRTKRVD